MSTRADRDREEKNQRLAASVRAGIGPIIGHRVPVAAARLASGLLDIQKDGCPVHFQLLKSVNSVGASYVEGQAKADRQEVVRFLKISRGSAYEAVFHAQCVNSPMLSSTYALARMVDEAIEEALADT